MFVCVFFPVNDGTVLKVLNDKNCIGEIQLDEYTSQVSTIEWSVGG